MLKPSRGRVGVFVLTIYADHAPKQGRGQFDRMILWPQGQEDLTTLEVLAVLDHLADISKQIVRKLLDGAQQSEERGPLDQYRLAAVKPKGGKGAVFDATA